MNYQVGDIEEQVRFVNQYYSVIVIARRGPTGGKDMYVSVRGGDEGRRYCISFNGPFMIDEAYHFADGLLLGFNLFFRMALTGKVPSFFTDESRAPALF